jgi:hypothetical protein
MAMIVAITEMVVAVEKVIIRLTPGIATCYIINVTSYNMENPVYELWVQFVLYTPLY